jgi:hypothetical protein
MSNETTVEPRIVRNQADRRQLQEEERFTSRTLCTSHTLDFNIRATA